MTTPRVSDPSVPAGRPWLIRGVVVGAFLATVYFAGPRAWRVVRGHLAGAAPEGPVVALDRVRFPNVPEWLRGDLARLFFADLAPRLEGEIRLMDDAGLAALQQRLAESPWLEDVVVAREYPDRFRIGCRILRPECRLVIGEQVRAVATGEGDILPATTVAGAACEELPVIDLGPDPGDDTSWAADPRIAVAAGVAREWREAVAVQCPQAPPLVAVDADNLGWRRIHDPKYSEVLVALRREGGGVAWFHNGRAHDQGGAVRPDIRASVLRDVLREVPGLRGLIGGDLRLRNLWREALRRGPAAGASAGPR